MTDEAYSYHEDVTTRSIIKKSANHRKNGSATQKLGNRRMSWQEIYSKHGEVKEYDMKSFMTFSEFKEMPKDLQVEYVNNLQDKYDISIKHISRYLFNIGDEGLQSHLKMFDILKDCNPCKRRGKTGLEQFRDDIREFKRRERTVEIIDKQEEIERMNNGVQFITYAEFKKLSDDEKVNYINALIEKYQVSTETISTELFKNNKSCISNYMSTKKLSGKLARSGVHNPIKIKENRERFLNDIKLWENAKFETFIDIQDDNIKVDAVIPVTDVETCLKTVPNDIIPKVDIPEYNTTVEPLEPIVHHNLDDIIAAINYVKDIIDKELVGNTLISEDKEKEEIIAVQEPEDAYHDVSFASDYISIGLNLKELKMLEDLFKDRKVKVHMEVMAL